MNETIANIKPSKFLIMQSTVKNISRERLQKYKQVKAHPILSMKSRTSSSFFLSNCSCTFLLIDELTPACCFGSYCKILFTTSHFLVTSLAYSCNLLIFFSSKSPPISIFTFFFYLSCIPLFIGLKSGDSPSGDSGGELAMIFCGDSSLFFPVISLSLNSLFLYCDL